jgi:hypothetical protein
MDDREEQGVKEAVHLFETHTGITGIEYRVSPVGPKLFLKFMVGRESPFYLHAIRETQRALPTDNPFRGAIGLEVQKSARFPDSLEAAALQTLLTKSTRAVSEDTSSRGFSVPYVPFQNKEDHQLAQPATHVVVGRRGVGKSTLIRRATDTLRESKSLVAVIDMQAYSEIRGDDLARELLSDVVAALCDDAPRVEGSLGRPIDLTELKAVTTSLSQGLAVGTAVPRLKRAIQGITKNTGAHAFVFLDDCHLVIQEEQPRLLHLVHGALKGANGWLKVAGLRSLLNVYSPRTREGLQVPGDAQTISLDLTLENPQAAENHLRAILDSFLRAVGYSFGEAVLPAAAFRRLVWANAGVPRDFLQMFARASEHSRRNKHAAVTLSDINVAINEFGQRKIDEMSQDARNSQGELRTMLSALESYCLDNKEHRINAFQVKSEDSLERQLIHTLSDLRLVHLIHQSTTPFKAGERYEAFILDYSLFIGYRRRLNIQEMLPEDEQFKASELRKLPRVSKGFLEEHEAEEDD